MAPLLTNRQSSKDPTMHTYELLLIDPTINAVIGRATVHADDRGEAVRNRPDGWTRCHTRARMI